MNLRPAAAVLFLALCTQTGMAEQRTATIGISARVVRSCAVQSATVAGTPVLLTCSRDATPGVVTGASSITLVPPLRTTSIEPIQPALLETAQTETAFAATAWAETAFAEAAFAETVPLGLAPLRPGPIDRVATDRPVPAPAAVPGLPSPSVRARGSALHTSVAVIRTSARSAHPVATPIATPAVPLMRPSNASAPARSNEHQVVTINF